MELAGWIDLVSPSELHQLLTMVAGPEMENASGALRLLVGYAGKLDESLKEFARDCLLAADLGYGEDYACDQIAATLARLDHAFGFDLLERLLKRGYSADGWKLIENTAGLHFGRLLWNWTRNGLCVCFAIFRGKIRI